MKKHCKIYSAYNYYKLFVFYSIINFLEAFPLLVSISTKYKPELSVEVLTTCLCDVKTN